MVSNTCLSDIEFLQHVGWYTALVPVTKENSSKTSKWNPFSFNYLLLLASIIILICQTIWDWDDLIIPSRLKTSEKITSVIFHFALYLSSGICRLTFLIGAPICFRFFTNVKSYLKEYVPTNAKTEKNFYKVTSLAILNGVYLVQLTRFVILKIKTLKSGTVDLQENNCHRFLLSCDSNYAIIIISIIIEFVASAPIYYLTYFAIVMSDLFAQILNSFEQDVVNGLQFVNIDPNKTSNTGVSRKNLHKQFSKLKSLFDELNAGLGLTFLVQFFSDLLIMICIAFTLTRCLAQQLSRRNYPMSTTDPWNFTTEIPYFEDIAPLINPCNCSDMVCYNNTKEMHNDFAHSAGGGLAPSNEEDHGEFIADLIYYVCATLYECRAILLAAIGSYLKNKVSYQNFAFKFFFFNNTS